MRLPEQVEVFLFRFVGTSVEFLLCKRIPGRGGFWQPLTGGVEDTDVSRLEAARREAGEETGIMDIQDLFAVDFTFEFFVKVINRNVTEYVFAGQILPTSEITLSHEHEEFVFVDYDEALRLLKYDTNKEALKKAFQTIRERYNITE